MGIRYERNHTKSTVLSMQTLHNVSHRAHNIATLGECGRYPLYILTAIKAIKYWNKIPHMPEHRYVHKCYKSCFSGEAKLGIGR